MYKVYFNNHSISFDREARNAGSLQIAGAEVARADDIAKLLQIFEISDSIEVLSDDFEEVFAHFCSFFIEALNPIQWFSLYPMYSFFNLIFRCPLKT